MHIHDTDSDRTFEKLYISLGRLSNGTHRLKTKGKAMQRECSNGDGGERVQVVPTGKSTTRQNEVEECYQWPILLSGVKDRVVSNIYHYELISKCWGFFFIEEETDFPFFGRYFEIMTIINNGKYFLR